MGKYKRTQIVRLPKPLGGGAPPCINGLLDVPLDGSHFHYQTDHNGIAFFSIFNGVSRMGLHFFRTEIKKNIFPKVTKKGSIIGHKIDREKTVMG